MQKQSEKYQNLPAQVREFLESLSDYPWFQPESVDYHKVGELIKEHQQRLQAFGMKKSYPLKIITDWKVASQIAKDVASAIPRQASWNATRLQVIKNARIYIDDVAFNQSLQITEEIVQAQATRTVSDAIWMFLQEMALEMLQEDLRGIMFDVSWAIAYDAARNSVWYIAEDEMKTRGHENPFEPLMEIYRMGLWPIGLIREKGIFGTRRCFAVFVPSNSII